jgi:hypothetical protein
MRILSLYFRKKGRIIGDLKSAESLPGLPMGSPNVTPMRKSAANNRDNPETYKY